MLLSDFVWEPGIVFDCDDLHSRSIEAPGAWCLPHRAFSIAESLPSTRSGVPTQLNTQITVGPEGTPKGWTLLLQGVPYRDPWVGKVCCCAAAVDIGRNRKPSHVREELPGFLTDMVRSRRMRLGTFNPDVRRRRATFRLTGICNISIGTKQIKGLVLQNRQTSHHNQRRHPHSSLLHHQRKRRVEEVCSLSISLSCFLDFTWFYFFFIYLYLSSFPYTVFLFFFLWQHRLVEWRLFENRSPNFRTLQSLLPQQRYHHLW